MKIFKLFFSLVNAYRVRVLVNIVLLFALYIPLNLAYTSNLDATFDQIPGKFGLINHEPENQVANHFVDYLEEQAEVVEIPDKAEDIADALYYKEANYIIEIPTGFGDALLANETLVPLKKTVGPEASEETYADIIIENYIKSFQIVNATGLAEDDGSAGLDQLLTEVDQVVADGSDIQTSTATETNLDASTIGFGMSFTHIASYLLIMTLITVFGLPMISMRNPEIMKRDRMGDITPRQRNTQLLLACNLFGLILWLVMMVLGGLVYGFDTLTSTHGLLFLLSSFVAMLGVQQMCFFIVTVASTKGMVSFLSTGVSLILAFTSGIFVPRQFVSPFMQQIAQIATPIWQVKTNEIIVSAENLSNVQMTEIYQNMGIQLLIAVSYLALTYIYRSYKYDASEAGF